MSPDSYEKFKSEVSGKMLKELTESQIKFIINRKVPVVIAGKSGSPFEVDRFGFLTDYDWYVRANKLAYVFMVRLSGADKLNFDDRDVDLTRCVFFGESFGDAGYQEIREILDNISDNDGYLFDEDTAPDDAYAREKQYMCESGDGIGVYMDCEDALFTCCDCFHSER